MSVFERVWSGPLVLFTGTPPELEWNGLSSVAFPRLAGIPKAAGLRPTIDFNQCELYWGIMSMPNNGTYVDLTYCGFRAPLDNVTTGAQSFDAGYPVSVNLRYELFLQQWLELNPSNAYAIPHNQSLRRTAVDATATINGQTYNFGTRHSIPIADPYFCFLINSDGSGGTAADGKMILWANLMWVG